MYLQTLSNLGARFPGTGNLDGQFAWHAPVKAYSNHLAVLNLIKQKILTREFSADVLAIDYQNPLFSKKRCALLHYVPNRFSKDWLRIFTKNLKSSNNATAKELYRNIVDPDKNVSFHRNNAATYLMKLQSAIQTPKGMHQAIVHLQKLRYSVYKDEISQNPRGQIFEPGFRVIFPTW